MACANYRKRQKECCMDAASHCTEQLDPAASCFAEEHLGEELERPDLTEALDKSLTLDVLLPVECLRARLLRPLPDGILCGLSFSAGLFVAPLIFLGEYERRLVSSVGVELGDRIENDFGRSSGIGGSSSPSSGRSSSPCKVNGRPCMYETNSCQLMRPDRRVPTSSSIDNVLVPLNLSPNTSLKLLLVM